MRKQSIIEGAIRRQQIINVLLEHGPLMLAEIAECTGYTKDRCSNDLNTAQARGEVEQVQGTNRKNGRWVALTRIATFSDPRQYSARQREQMLKRMQDKVNEKSVPGLRVVRLLDKPASKVGTGGQCAGRGYGSIQCNFHEKGLHL